MLSIEEKPLVRAAFLLCKKVRYFIATDAMYLLTKVFFSLSLRAAKSTLRLSLESSSGGNLSCTSVLGVFEVNTMV